MCYVADTLLSTTHLLTYQNLPTKHMKKDVLSFLFWTTILSGLAYLTASSMAQQYRICLQCKRHGFDPWVRKILWRRKWQPTPVFLPRESHGQRKLTGYSLKELTWLSDWTTTRHACNRWGNWDLERSILILASGWPKLSHALLTWPSLTNTWFCEIPWLLHHIMIITWVGWRDCDG